jgi:hypothetical protein
VETSFDGVTWTVAAEQAPGGPALAGAIADPLGVPLRVLLPEVSARYVRINAALFRETRLTLYGP